MNIKPLSICLTVLCLGLVTSESLAKKDEKGNSINPNKLLPIDYQKHEVNSREIWFKPGGYGYKCARSNLFGDFNSFILRSGNLLLKFHIGYDLSKPKLSKYTKNYLKSKNKHLKVMRNKHLFFDLKIVPKNSLVGYSGVNGLKFDKVFTFEVNQNVKSYSIEYSAGIGDLSTCSNTISPSFYQDLRTRKKYEMAHAEAVKRVRSQNKQIAPALKRREIEKTPPTIVLNEHPNRTDSYKTFIRGQVLDESGVFTVLVNGKKAGVKADGSFAARVQLAFGANKISVQAEDVNGNLAERKIMIIREDYIPEMVLADVDMPPKTEMNNPDAIAVVIGVESYQYVAPATYAYNDAEVFREYLSETLGYRKSRIKIVTNTKATQAEMNKLLGPNGWIARNIKPEKSDVVVYFSGHGIPDARTKKTGLLPHDVDPNYSVGLTLKTLYDTLGSLKARSVTVFLDTCFSGQGRERQTLLADARGIMIVPKEKAEPNKITVLSAATAGQISGPIKDKEHGLFTYFVLKGLGGEADSNKDKKLTMAELGKYVHAKVKEVAALEGREQTPELQGEGNRTLVRW